MTILLDTHTLVWALIQPGKLSPTATSLIADTNNTIVVSAASAWEIATKVRLGKFPEAANLEKNLLENIAAAGYATIVIDPEIALRAGRFMADHGDPFDRMLAAHAIALDIPIISRDPQLDAFGLRRIW